MLHPPVTLRFHTLLHLIDFISLLFMFFEILFSQWTTRAGCYIIIFIILATPNLAIKQQLCIMDVACSAKWVNRFFSKVYDQVISAQGFCVISMFFL